MRKNEPMTVVGKVPVHHPAAPKSQKTLHKIQGIVTLGQYHPKLAVDQHLPRRDLVSRKSPGKAPLIAGLPTHSPVTIP
jgi:hypothetical protein